MVVGFGIGYDHGQLWWNAVQCCVKCDAKCGAMHSVANTIRRDLKCGIEYMACGVMWYICKMGCNARCGATGCIMWPIHGAILKYGIAKWNTVREVLVLYGEEWCGLE